MHRALALIAILVVGLAAEDGSSRDLLTRLLVAQQSITSVSGRLVQRNIRVDDPEGGGNTHEATFALEVPDKYNLVYTKPGDDEWRLRMCSDGKVRRQIEQMFADQQPDVSESVVGGGAGDGGAGNGGGGTGIGERISEFLRFDPIAVNKDFIVSIATAGEGFRLDLLPRGGDLARQVKGISIDLDTQFRTREVRFDDPQGNRIVISVVEAVYNVAIPPETFTYSPAK